MPHIAKDHPEYVRLLEKFTAATDAYHAAKDDAARSAAYDRAHEATHGLLAYLRLYVVR
jgi:hypothetical protein